jgi:hypothetical protein
MAFAVLIMMLGAGISAGVAGSKNRNPAYWFLWGALFPLPAVIAALVISRREDAHQLSS